MAREVGRACLIKLGCVGRDAGDRYNCGRPSVIEGVGVFCGRGLGRGSTGVSGRLAVGDLFGLQRVVVAVQPCDGVLVDGGGVSRFIRRRAGNSYRFGIPSVERIGILRGRRLCRIGVSRDGAVSDSSGVDDRIVVVQPRDRVLVDGGGIGRFIRCRAGNSYRFGIPSVERIGILRGRRLCRIGMGRNSAVSDISGVDDGIVVVQPCNGVLVDGGGVSRFIRCRAGNSYR